MAQIDSFLTRLQQQNASRIVLQGNAAMQIELPNGISQGAALDNARVGELIGEILPPEARAQLEELGAASFTYASPLGSCQAMVSRPGGLWRLEIVPPAVAPEPQMMAAPLQNVAVQANDSGQPNAVLPPELGGFNWGGLLLSGIWAIGHNSWIGLLVMGAIMFPVFGRARENARRSACQARMKQIALGVYQYAEDHGGKCPTGTTMAAWQTAIKPNLMNNVLKCPSARDGEDSYILNPKLAGVNLENLIDPAATPMFFDADARHLNGLNVAFADGHIKWYRSDVWGSGNLPQTSKFQG